MGKTTFEEIPFVKNKMSKPVKKTSTAPRPAKVVKVVKPPKVERPANVVMNLADACLDEAKEGKRLVLPISLFTTLKKLGGKKCISWFPTFGLEATIDGKKYEIFSNAVEEEFSDDFSDDADADSPHHAQAGANRPDEFMHPDESLNYSSSSGGGSVVTVKIGDVTYEYEYEAFWDVVDTLKSEKGKRLNSFKFFDTTSGINVIRKRLLTSEASDAKPVFKTVVRVESGKFFEKKKGEETVEKSIPLFEVELSDFAEYSGSEGLKLLARIF